MADGSRGDRTDPKQINDLTFSADYFENGDSKKCYTGDLNDNRVRLSFYIERETSESCEKSASLGVAATCAVAVSSEHPRKSSHLGTEESDNRKKRCFDRYDSSESSDSGVAVLSPSESGVCSGSDTSPPSPSSPSPSPAPGDEPARMPPWITETASAPPAHRRRITEYFNHKMKPQNGLKRDTLCNNYRSDLSKRKCLPKNGIKHDLEKYISYLSQTLNPRVLLDIDKPTPNSAHAQPDTTDVSLQSTVDSSGTRVNSNTNGFNDFGRSRDMGIDKIAHRIANGLLDEIRQDSNTKPNGKVDIKKQHNVKKSIMDPSAKCMNRKNQSNEARGVRIAPTSQVKKNIIKSDNSKINGVVSSTTSNLDSDINGVTCGSNNLVLTTLNTKTPKYTPKKEQQKRTTPIAAKRANRKSSACTANSKNLTWSKANNLKQALQKQNTLHNGLINNVSSDTTNASPTITISNGVRQMPITMNGNINSLNMSVPNMQNCHQINITQGCNRTVTSTNLASFVAVPQNVMLTTLRIPQNGLTAQAVGQHNNINAFNRSNVTSPSKINGQFVFPIMQNLNGAVVQIPNIMAKVGTNFVLPQSPQLGTPRQDHNMQPQQATQFLINGTLLKLANTMSSGYSNLNKNNSPAGASIPVMNKNIVPGIPSVGMTVQSKTNFTVNISHPLLLPQPGFIVNSVPNIDVKETWSNPTQIHTTTAFANTVVSPPVNTNILNQALPSSSIPIAPVKPPDKPKETLNPHMSLPPQTDYIEMKKMKCDIPWLSKTVNNNNVHLDANKLAARPFANICNLNSFNSIAQNDILRMDKTSEELRKVEEVARREETIFTQITVLKDVSSNVQNTVIESDFSSITNESSESGICTDKSIDSPSDSQTSKECDEDSTLSLSVSVCSMEVQGSQKSPILKQPKTLRFPPKNMLKGSNNQRASSSDTSASVTVCLWENCSNEFESDTDLLEHLQVSHVETQAGRENYVCLWAKCKVRGKPSCSRLWLERHALSHGGNKPFKCIVDGCGRRFTTQILLERHVNNHFNEQSPNTNSAKKTTDSAPKLIRRNGKKLRYRRQPWSARMFDFFDAGMMEGLAWRLARSTRWRLGGTCPLREPAGRHTLTLHAALAATRYNHQQRRREALLTYYPPHVLEDEWVPEKDVKRIKRVEISQLPVTTKVLLYEQFCASYRSCGSPPPPAAPSPPSPRKLPVRHCTSSRLLNNLIAKQKKEPKEECKSSLIIYNGQEDRKADVKNEVTGAAKRKLGRRYGGNAFWPCGR